MNNFVPISRYCAVWAWWMRCTSRVPGVLDEFKRVSCSFGPYENFSTQPFLFIIVWLFVSMSPSAVGKRHPREWMPREGYIQRIHRL